MGRWICTGGHVQSVEAAPRGLGLGPVPTVKGFAGDDDDGTARVLTAAGFCRSTTRFTWMERPLPRVGARVSKAHFWIRAKPATGGEDAEMVLAVARKGARASPQLGAEELQSLVCDSLAGHARIFATEACSLDRGLAVIVREWSDGGSLRVRKAAAMGKKAKRHPRRRRDADRPFATRSFFD